MKHIKYFILYEILLSSLIFAANDKFEIQSAIELSSLIFQNSEMMVKIGLGRFDFLFFLGYLAIIWTSILYSLSSVKEKDNEYRAMVMCRYERRKTYFVHSLLHNILSSIFNSGILILTYFVLLFLIGVKIENNFILYVSLYLIQLIVFFSWLGILNRLIILRANSGISFCILSILGMLIITFDTFIDGADCATFSNHLSSIVVGLGINLVINLLCILVYYRTIKKFEL